jgi:flagellar hook-associated protein 3 FlgL
MIGRITNQMSSSLVLSGIESALDRLDTTQEQLSTGKQINQPSDDPYGTSITLEMNEQLSDITAYSGNVTDGTAWAQASTSALSDMTGAVQRVQELVEEAANGSENQNDMQDAANEVNQLIDEIKQDANTQCNGQYIFSGSATSTQPYPASSAGGPTDPYAGDTNNVNREIGPNTSLPINVQLSSVLGTGQTTAGQSAGDGGLLNTLRNIADDMQSGNSAALSGTDLTALGNNLNSLLGLSATAGSVSDRLQMASSRLESLQTSDTQVLSNTQDADMAQTEINFSTEQAALTAALQAGANIVQQSLMSFLGTSSG